MFGQKLLTNHQLIFNGSDDLSIVPKSPFKADLVYLNVKFHTIQSNCIVEKNLKYTSAQMSFVMPLRCFCFLKKNLSMTVKESKTEFLQRTRQFVPSTKRLVFLYSFICSKYIIQKLKLQHESGLKEGITDAFLMHAFKTQTERGISLSNPLLRSAGETSPGLGVKSLFCSKLFGIISC